MSNYFSHFKHYKAFIIRFWFLVALAFLTSVNAIASISVERNKEEQEQNESLKGVKVEFDYKGHPNEREIAYKFYKANYDFDKIHPLKRAEIGIYLYDIDRDGEKEILTYLDNGDYCDGAGCEFNLLKISGEPIPMTSVNGMYGIACARKYNYIRFNNIKISRYKI